MHRGMRLICITMSVGRCIRRRQVHLFPTEAPLCRGSPAVYGKTIHPHTCICNEIISLPPRAAISQPPVPGRARSHTRGWDAEEKELGEVRNRYSRAAGQTGKYTVPERAEDEKRSPKGNKRCRESRRNKTEPQKHIVYGDEQRISTTSPKFINVVE